MHLAQSAGLPSAAWRRQANTTSIRIGAGRAAAWPVSPGHCIQLGAAQQIGRRRFPQEAGTQLQSWSGGAQAGTTRRNWSATTPRQQNQTVTDQVAQAQPTSCSCGQGTAANDCPTSSGAGRHDRADGDPPHEARWRLRRWRKVRLRSTRFMSDPLPYIREVEQRCFVDGRRIQLRPFPNQAG